MVADIGDRRIGVGEGPTANRSMRHEPSRKAVAQGLALEALEALEVLEAAGEALFQRL